MSATLKARRACPSTAWVERMFMTGNITPIPVLSPSDFEVGQAQRQLRHALGYDDILGAERDDAAVALRIGQAVDVNDEPPHVDDPKLRHAEAGVDLRLHAEIVAEARFRQ